MVTKFDASTLPKVVTVYKVTRKTSWGIAEKENLLLFITSGQCSFEINGDVYNLKRGDFLYLPELTQYQREPIDDNFYSLYYVHFFAPHTSISKADAQKELIDLSKQPTFSDNNLLVATTVSAEDDFDEVNNILDKMTKIRASMEVKNELYLSLCMQYLLSIVAKKSQNKIISGLKSEHIENFPDPLKDAVFYIKTHLDQKITLDDLCKAAMVSPQQLIRYFKKFTSKTPNAYITDYKINVAKDYIMRSKELSIKTIAYELGFEDQCYFSRVFSKTTGESPTEYYIRVKNYVPPIEEK